MPDECKKLLTLKAGPQVITSVADTSTDAGEQVLKSAQLWGEATAAGFVASGCPASCPIMMYRRTISIPGSSMKSRQVTDATGKVQCEESLEVKVEAWKICFPESFWLPIVGDQFRPPKPATEKEEREVPAAGVCQCGGNEWRHRFLEFGPARPTRADAEAAVKTYVVERCRELVKDWVLRTSCPAECPVRLVVPGPIRTSVVSGMHNPDDDTWKSSGEATFSARIYCLKRKEAEGLLDSLRKNGYLDGAERDALALPAGDD